MAVQGHPRSLVFWYENYESKARTVVVCCIVSVISLFQVFCWENDPTPIPPEVLELSHWSRSPTSSGNEDPRIQLVHCLCDLDFQLEPYYDIAYLHTFGWVAWPRLFRCLSFCLLTDLASSKCTLCCLSQEWRLGRPSVCMLFFKQFVLIMCF